MTSICYIVPVHNDERHLEKMVAQLVEYLKKQPLHFLIILVENGSQDASPQKVMESAQKFSDCGVQALSLKDRGMGFALSAGMNQGLKIKEEKNLSDFWFILTASDLPFGFSDLEEFRHRLSVSPQFKIAIGSKAHPQSQVKNSRTRKIASLCYRWARGLILHMKVRDSQGSIFILSSLAQDLIPLVRSRDFFYSTELIYWAEKQKIPIVELPVVLAKECRPSSVHLLRDSWRMLKQMMALKINSLSKFNL